MEIIKQYGYYIALGVIFILEVVLMCVKRKPTSLDEFSRILNDAVRAVPSMVSHIEEKVGPGQGDIKRSVVLTASIDYIEKLLGRSLTELEYKRCCENLCAQIEDVLSTPTKKGGIGREEVE